MRIIIGKIIKYMEEILMVFTKEYKYGEWENCVKLENNEIELVATTDIGQG